MHNFQKGDYALAITDYEAIRGHSLFDSDNDEIEELIRTARDHLLD